MNGWRITWSGSEMPWRNQKHREVVMSKMDGSVSMSRCSHYGHSLDTNTPHIPSLVNQLSVPISRTTGAYNCVSFWQVNEGGHKIIANRKMCDESVYNKWWKQPDKYKVFGVTIHEIEKAMDIRDNKPFKQSEEKFSRLEELLKVSFNVFEITLLPG